MKEPNVIYSGSGRIENGVVIRDPQVVAHCQACQQQVDVVVELAGHHVCIGCMRRALDASSVARYRLSEGSGSLPWGKVTS